MEHYVGLDVSLRLTAICIIILHRIWIDGTEFNCSSKELAANAHNRVIEFPPTSGR